MRAFPAAKCPRLATHSKAVAPPLSTAFVLAPARRRTKTMGACPRSHAIVSAVSCAISASVCPRWSICRGPGSVSAPALSSKLTAPSWPCSQAHMSAVWPSASRSSIVAGGRRSLSNSVMTDFWPPIEAAISKVILLHSSQRESTRGDSNLEVSGLEPLQGTSTHAMTSSSRPAIADSRTDRGRAKSAIFRAC
eukprot:876935-Prymnesium_polylepis.1